MDIGESIRNARKEKGYTQIELARIAKIAVNSLRLYEAGKRQPPLEVIRRIAIALETTVSELVCENFWKNLSAEEQANAFDTDRASLLVAYDSMNETGKRKAVEQVEDLAKIPDYQKKPDEG